MTPFYHRVSRALGRGDHAQPVPEVRYDVHGTCIHYEKPGRYRGLDADQASALSDALYYDQLNPYSPCLLTLRKLWVKRAASETDDEVTRVDKPTWQPPKGPKCKDHGGDGTALVCVICRW